MSYLQVVSCFWFGVGTFAGLVLMGVLVSVGSRRYVREKELEIDNLKARVECLTRIVQGKASIGILEGDA